MRLTSYQPQYFPRLHYFARILNSDIYKISDQVQYVRDHVYPMPDGGRKRGKSYQAHASIKTASGAYLLTIPIKKHQGLQRINETKIEYAVPWGRKHAQTIAITYGRAPYFKKIYPDLAAILGQTYPHLAALNATTIFWALSRILGAWDVPLERIDLRTVNALLEMDHPFRLKRTVFFSEIDAAPAREGEDANDRIIGACKRLGVDEYYYGGTGAAAYMDFEKFVQAGIHLVEQRWDLTPYRQQHPEVGFLANLSIIDLLANEPTETVQAILKGE